MAKDPSDRRTAYRVLVKPEVGGASRAICFCSGIYNNEPGRSENPKHMY